MATAEDRRRNIAAVITIGLGVLIGLFLKKVKFGMVIGLLLGLVAAGLFIRKRK
jgi:F0F1-type ATP synthase assembly protein I